MRPLSMPLPLRTTIAWGEFLNVVPIPWVYGRCDVAPIPYNTAKTEWCIADHAIGGVDKATIAGAEAPFLFRNTTDKTGHPMALLELATAPKDNGAVAVTVRGALHPTTGEMIDNPADVAWDILRRSGIAVPAAEWADFRRQCTTAGITVGGALSGAMTIRAALDSLLSGIGAVWSGGSRGWARLWPPN